MSRCAAWSSVTARWRAALVDAAEQITGHARTRWCRCPTPAATAATSRSGSTRPSATGPTVVFVDMPSGSCLFAVLRRLRERARRARGDRRQSRDAARLRVPPRRHARRGGGRARSRSARRRSRSRCMTLVLCRVDDRLIHGQVVVGWGRPLGIAAHRAGGRRGGGERLGAGPLPHGGAAGLEVGFASDGRGGGRSCAAWERATRAAACSSPATSPPWPRSTRRTRR